MNGWTCVAVASSDGIHTPINQPTNPNHPHNQVWHEFCLRHGRCMARAGIGRRATWGGEYALSVEIFDRKGGFRLFCSYGRVSVMHQQATSDGRWLTKLAVTGFASCWHFSAASRDPRDGRFASVREYFERAHERGLEHCLCTEVGGSLVVGWGLW